VTTTDVRRSDMRLASEAWESLFRAQVAVMRRFSRDALWAQLSMREYDVLFTLSRCGPRPMRLNELNEHILLSQPSLSRMVERLEATGLVRREPSAADRRGTVISLTPEGAEVQRRIGRQHVRTIGRYVGTALDDDELRTLGRLCDKLRHAQQDIPD
jgi:DNA-binding MarR family transcriptional regulator